MTTGGTAGRHGTQMIGVGSARERILTLWGERVALHRVAGGLTQTQLGDAVGVSRDTIARIERGSRRVPDELRVAFATVFDLPAEVLFPYAEVPAPVRPGRRRTVTADEVPRRAVA